jgi:GMP synthase (glutamine-hydrolysing)
MDTALQDRSGNKVIGDILRKNWRIIMIRSQFQRRIANAGLDRQINQYFTVLTGMRSVGDICDERHMTIHGLKGM